MRKRLLNNIKTDHPDVSNNPQETKEPEPEPAPLPPPPPPSPPPKAPSPPPREPTPPPKTPEPEPVYYEDLFEGWDLVAWVCDGRTDNVHKVKDVCFGQRHAGTKQHGNRKKNF